METKRGSIDAAHYVVSDDIHRLSSVSLRSANSTKKPAYRMNLLLAATTIALPGSLLGVLLWVAVLAVVIWAVSALLQWSGITIPPPVKIIAIALVCIFLILLLFRLFGAAGGAGL